jgi:hypothetical protein
MDKKQILANVLTVILGLLILACFPLLLVWGLKLLGAPVTVSFSSWSGAAVILIFLVIANRISRLIKTK